MRVFTFIKWLFFLIGIGLAAVAIHNVRITQRFLAHAAEFPGEVVEQIPQRSSKGGTTYSLRVRYAAADGEPRSFVTSFSTNPPAYDLGEAVTVLHDPSGAAQPRVRGFMSLWGLAVIVGGIGTVFLLISGVLIASDWTSAARGRRLRGTGQPLDAELQAVEVNHRVKVGRRHPFVVVCRWQEAGTGRVHLFRSENLWEDPTPHLGRGKVRVFIEPGNPRRYVVDLSFLPGKA